MAKKEVVVTPWDVSGKVDYKKLIKQFGTQEIDKAILTKIKKYAGELHFMLRRKIFFSHRDLKYLLKNYENGTKFFLYTGRGPSNKVHLGHLVVWSFTQWLQDKFDADLYFQMSDDEKFLFKQDLTYDKISEYSKDNVLDIIALGFDKKKTFIFNNTEFSHVMYKEALRIAKHINFSTAKAVFGFNNQSNIGQIFYTSMQSVPVYMPNILYGKNDRCLVPLAIDQDPHFRVTRDVIEKLGYKKPAIIHSKFLPSLKDGDKMSSTAGEAIYTTDTEKTVNKKVSQAKTGGRDTLEQQKKLGGNPDDCRVFDYYTFFFEPDDQKLEQRKKICKGGKLMCGICKKELAQRINKFLKNHQKKREQAKLKVKSFMLDDAKIICQKKPKKE